MSGDVGSNLPPVEPDDKQSNQGEWVRQGPDPLFHRMAWEVLKAMVARKKRTGVSSHPRNPHNHCCKGENLKQTRDLTV